ncbi:hypothetical protein N9W89_06280 [Hellea sp.]|nr:hypothetical protein [Hellea sp.]
MLKLLFCSTLMVPFIYLQAFKSDDAPIIEANTPSYQDFVETKLENFEQCQDTNITLYFHDTYLTSHSAEYLGESIKTAAPCDYDAATIITRIPENASNETRAMLKEQSEELMAFVKAYDTPYDIDQKVVEIEVDTSYLNGGTSFVSFSSTNEETRS